MLKSSLGIAIAFSLCAVAHAANQGQGVVNFKGTVIDAPCGIAPESADQTIDFGQISKTHLENSGISVKKDVDIKLVNCDLSGGEKKVKVTFSGRSLGDGTELGTAGNTGTAIKMSAADGSFVKFDGATSVGSYNLKTGDNTMRYSAWVQKASTASSVTEGAFTAVANFNLTYE
ncbi:fimbrial protein [Escherichia coli]|uniref:fimbrial protein n=1 Tax=Escherichia coli TaxID=562 RepID=UPI00280689EE|nr:fimbrial protein [Escherichia coli]MDQ8061171.1 fimbrial protein [Escherichia coli]